MAAAESELQKVFCTEYDETNEKTSKITGNTVTTPVKDTTKILDSKTGRIHVDLIVNVA